VLLIQDQNSNSFSISSGQLVPLPGYKRTRGNWDLEENEVIKNAKKLKLSDFGSVMKGVFAHKFNLKLGAKNVSGRDLEDFKTYLGHYKSAQQETANFLSYFNSREVGLLFLLLEF